MAAHAYRSCAEHSHCQANGTFVLIIHIHIISSLPDSSSGTERNSTQPCLPFVHWYLALSKHWSILRHPCISELWMIKKKKKMFVFTPACVSSCKCKQEVGKVCVATKHNAAQSQSRLWLCGREWRSQVYCESGGLWRRERRARVHVWVYVVDAGQNSSRPKGTRLHHGHNLQRPARGQPP